MPLAHHIPILSVILSILTGVVGSFFKNPKVSRRLTLGSITLITVLSAYLLFHLQTSGVSSFVYNAGHFPAPWGNTLKATSLEALLSVVFGVVMLLSILGGTKDLNHDIKKSKRYVYYLMLNLLFSSLLAIVYTNDIFTGYVFLEINTLAACSIVVAKENGDTIRATIKYFVMSALGSGLFLFAIALLYSITGQLAMDSLHTAIAALMTSGEFHFTLSVALVFIFIAIASKSALFPFHNWLPDAHGSGTSTSSAILSGLVLKGYIVLFIKIIYRVYGLETVKALKVMPIVLVMGLVAMIMGSIFALLQKDTKKMIAYSSVAQIGYIFTGIGLGTTAGMVAAVFQIIAHAVTKSALFITAGSMIHSIDDYRISKLKGIGPLMPITMGVFTIGALSMIGIPPLVGFSSKWQLVEAMIGSSHIWLIVLITISSLLNTLYYLPIVTRAYFTKEAQENKKTGKKLEGSFASLWPIMALGVLIIVLGMTSGPIIKIITQGILNI